MKLKYVLIDIKKYNANDNVEEFVKNTDLTVVYGVDAFLENGIMQSEEAFLITDNIDSSEIAKKLNIGFAAYYNGQNISDALYCIENIGSMSDKNIIRMYERANSIPWDILETEHTLVREITLADVDDLYKIYSDKEVSRYIENLYEDREEELRFTRDYINNQYRFFEYGMWVVTQKGTGGLIGRAGIFGREDQELLELGFVFAKEYWGTGIAYEVLSNILVYAREELLTEQIIAHTVHENIRSEKILKKLGFAFEGEAIVEGKKYDRYMKYLP